ncbi:MAG: FAD-binding protein [Prolixibacteraceae bacterium]|nr:FAD-binding protein [Prolixibacteraceae bacterium]
MKQEINLSLSPKQASEEQFYKPILADKLHVDESRIKLINVKRKSIDARQRLIKINLGVEVFIDELPSEERIEFKYDRVDQKPPVIIVGAGPAGLFAALRLIELGFKPIIFERGKNVSERKRDIAKIHREHLVDPDSNYGFGEGGAGTFSDGKLYTRSKKRGNIRRILEIFFDNGALPEILVDAHPHIGTNMLPGIITNIRNKIVEAGGEIHFNSRVADFLIEDDRCTGVMLADTTLIEAEAVILATGHSAREIYELLYERGISIEAKTFAVGVRAEHPQTLIDSIQYNQPQRGPYLPPATYSFVEQVDQRGVYSFCMCPGGIMVPAATAPGEMVINGMSPTRRNTKFANSGMVVEIRPEDLNEFRHLGVFAGLEFQRNVERLCFALNGKSQFAPAQRMADFVSGKFSQDLPESSYHPGLVSVPLHEKLPKRIRTRLQEAFQLIDKKAHGYLTNEAVVVGVESRTSSPIRIPRDEETFEHVKVKGLYPCGEGAGYAGGIVSSAMDGERCAEAFAEKYLKR